MIRIMALLASLLLATAPSALAQQTPSGNGSNGLMLSWRSNGLAPAGYAGRVAASGKGSVLATLEAVVNGSPANLAAYEVRWFLNDQLFQSGFGLQSVTIPVPEFHQDSMDVRVEIVDAPFLFSEGVMSVPLTDPLAVIVSRDRSEIHRGTNVLEADAYSFNVTDSSLLFYDWTVNGEIPDANEDPRDLTVTVDGDPTSPVDVGLTVSHPDNEGESDGTSLRLFPRTR